MIAATAPHTHLSFISCLRSSHLTPHSSHLTPHTSHSRALHPRPPPSSGRCPQLSRFQGRIVLSQPYPFLIYSVRCRTPTSITPSSPPADLFATASPFPLSHKPSPSSSTRCSLSTPQSAPGNKRKLKLPVKQTPPLQLQLPILQLLPLAVACWRLFAIRSSLFEPAR